MKKILGGLAILLIIGSVFVFVNQSFSKEKDNKSPIETASKTKVTLIEAKTEGDYNSLEDLQNLPIIVKGVNTEKNETELQYSKIDNSLIGGHTVSSFKITEVLQNQDSNSNIKIDNTISIMEYSFYDKETDTTYSYNGYTNMKKNEEYIIFLLPEENNMFPIGSIDVGKVPVDTKEIEILKEELEENPEIFEDVEELIENIEKVFIEVRDEYIK